MPLYTYKCTECGRKLEEKHSMSEKPEICSEVSNCEEDGRIDRDYNDSAISTKGTRTKEDPVQETGDVVEETIEEAREEVKQQKQDLKQTDYEPEP